MFLLNSCLGHFTAAPFQGHPLSRTYGVNLPSSLTTLLPLVLGFSPHPPVSVYGTGPYKTIAAFLGGQLVNFSTLRFDPHHVFSLHGGFAYRTDTSLVPVFPFLALTFCPRPHSSVYTEYRNFHLLSIDYDSRPRLRPRLTQRRSALLWKP